MIFSETGESASLTRALSLMCDVTRQRNLTKEKREAKEREKKRGKGEREREHMQ